MNRPMMKFSTANPTGEAPGMESVRLDVLKAAINNESAAPDIHSELAPVPQPVPLTAPTPPPVPLINKNIRLPADLVDFIDFTYTKDKRLKKQDAYTQALEAFFRPLMTR